MVTLPLCSDGPHMEKIADEEQASPTTVGLEPTISPCSEVVYQLQTNIPSNASSTYMMNWLQNSSGETESAPCYKLEICMDSPKPNDVAGKERAQSTPSLEEKFNKGRKFWGQANQAENHINYCNQLFTNNNQHQDFCYLFALSLEGQAATWFSINSNKFKSWNGLCKSFLLRFQKYDSDLTTF